MITFFSKHFISKHETSEVHNSRIIKRSNAKFSRFTFHIEAIITLYFFNLHDCAFNWNNGNKNIATR